MSKVRKTKGDAQSIVPVSHFDKNADERRLFYVALTRAKQGVTISYARTDGTNREVLPTEFLNELRPDLIEKIDGTVWDKKYNQDISFQFGDTHTDERSTINSLKDKDFIRELFNNQGLSPTALNNYLECPWKYFYQNLIRIPSIPNKHQLYGTAIHASLNDFFKKIISEDIGPETLLASFERSMHEQPFNPKDFDETFEKGKRALLGWYENYKGTWNVNTKTEYRINGIVIDHWIKITGVFDKVEWNDDDSVTVVDYKTGKSKSRNEMMGTTKGSDGNYYRQLTFYKLLLKYFNEGKYSMYEGVIDFIEPDDKGKYHKEVFQITDEEVSKLEATIITVADDIVNLRFWDTTCDDKDCEFCKLRSLMK